MAEGILMYRRCFFTVSMNYIAGKNICHVLLIKKWMSVYFPLSQSRPLLGGVSGALVPGADFEGAPKRRSTTGHKLIQWTLELRPA
jgi:hypothetical protein